MQTRTARIRVEVLLVARRDRRSASRRSPTTRTCSSRARPRPNVMVIMSNTVSMQYLPYVQGTTPNLPAATASTRIRPISKFGIAKSAVRAASSTDQHRPFQLRPVLVLLPPGKRRRHKYWSYQFTSNGTISGAALRLSQRRVQGGPVGTYYRAGHDRRRPDLVDVAGRPRHSGSRALRLRRPWFGDVPGGATCTCQTNVRGLRLRVSASIKSHTRRRSRHLVPVNGGQPYGQLDRHGRQGVPGRDARRHQPDELERPGAQTPAGNAGTVTLTYSASRLDERRRSQRLFDRRDSGLYMGFMRPGDWSLNSDCGGWFVQNSLPAVGIPRDYNSDLSCSLTTCAQPPEQSSGVRAPLRAAAVGGHPLRAGRHGHLHARCSPPDDNPGCCSTTVVHTGAGRRTRSRLMSTNDSHIPEDKMFANADDYFSTTDCFVNGVRADDPNKSCRTGRDHPSFRHLLRPAVPTAARTPPRSTSSA